MFGSHRGIPSFRYFLCCGLLVLAGCTAAQVESASPVTASTLEQRADTTAEKPQSPINVDWLFTWVKDFAGNTADLIPLPGMILTRATRMLSGNSSCNRFSAGYRYDDKTGSLSFKNLVNTRMMCQRPNADAENAILAALLATDGCRIVDGKLELLSKNEPVARLVAK